MAEAGLDPLEINSVQWPVIGSSADLLGNFSNLNNTVNCTLSFGCFFRYPLVLTIIYCVAYGAVLVVGILGNVCAFVVVMRDKTLHSVYYRFMANLAIADLLVLIFCLPVTLLGNLFGPWMLGLFLCKAVAYLQGVSVCASVYTLVAISVERFLAICFPLRWQVSARTCRLIICFIWIFSFILTLPWAFYFRLINIGRTSDGDQLYVCREIWPTEKMGLTYFIVAHLLLCYILPLIMIMISYGFIWYKVWKRKLPGEGIHYNSVVQRSKIKVVKMLFVVVLAFMISWLPLYAIFSRIKLGDTIPENSLEEFIIQACAPIAQWLGASNSCMNPLLYAFFNNKMKKGLVAVLFGDKCCNNNVSNVLMTSTKNRSLRTLSNKVRGNGSRKNGNKEDAI
ncbi:neuropeptide SIFamide receptor-like [Parasteatoda tepidariorum]|uniref:neuropeptide SIFamide receptor-like n=1 Tax=Parasteatoda tepidariorum TaxID=114398 RepID=UPI00077FBBE7|nr:neuropeptide SIFamide receptor-like [Parasteatoda tepidariorum]